MNTLSTTPTGCHRGHVKGPARRPIPTAALVAAGALLLVLCSWSDHHACASAADVPPPADKDANVIERLAPHVGGGDGHAIQQQEQSDATSNSATDDGIHEDEEGVFLHSSFSAGDAKEGIAPANDRAPPPKTAAVPDDDIIIPTALRLTPTDDAVRKGMLGEGAANSDADDTGARVVATHVYNAHDLPTMMMPKGAAAIDANGNIIAATTTTGGDVATSSNAAAAPPKKAVDFTLSIGPDGNIVLGGDMQGMFNGAGDIVINGVNIADVLKQALAGGGGGDALAIEDGEGDDEEDGGMKRVADEAAPAAERSAAAPLSNAAEVPPPQESQATPEVSPTSGAADSSEALNVLPTTDPHADTTNNANPHNMPFIDDATRAALAALGYSMADIAALMAGEGGGGAEGEEATLEIVDVNGNPLSPEDIARMTAEGAQIQMVDAEVLKGAAGDDDGHGDSEADEAPANTANDVELPFFLSHDVASQQEDAVNGDDEQPIDDDAVAAAANANNNNANANQQGIAINNNGGTRGANGFHFGGNNIINRREGDGVHGNGVGAAGEQRAGDGPKEAANKDGINTKFLDAGTFELRLDGRGNAMNIKHFSFNSGGANGSADGLDDPSSAHTNGKKKKKKKGGNSKRTPFRNPRLAAARAEWKERLAKAHHEQDEEEEPFEEYMDKKDKEAADKMVMKQKGNNVPTLSPIERMMRKVVVGGGGSSSSSTISPRAMLAEYQDAFEGFMAAERARAVNAKKAFFDDAERDHDEAATTTTTARNSIPTAASALQCEERLSRTYRIASLSLVGSLEAVMTASSDTETTTGLSLRLANPQAGRRRLLHALDERFRKDISHSACVGLLDSEGDVITTSSPPPPTEYDADDGTLVAAKDRIVALVGSIKLLVIKHTVVHTAHAVAEGSEASNAPAMADAAAIAHMCDHFFALSRETSFAAVSKGSLLTGGADADGSSSEDVSTSKTRLPGIAGKAIALSKATVSAMSAVAYDPTVGGLVTVGRLKAFVLKEEYLTQCPQLHPYGGEGAGEQHTETRTPEYTTFAATVVGELHYFASVLALEAPTTTAVGPSAAESSALAYLRLWQGRQSNLFAHKNGADANRHSAIAAAQLSDITSPSQAAGSPSSSSSLATAAAVMPQSCVAMTSGIYSEAFKRRRAMGRAPRPITIPRLRLRAGPSSSSASTNTAVGTDAYTDKIASFKASLASLSAGLGIGPAPTISRRYTRSYDIRGIGTDAQFHSDRYGSIINAWLGDGDLHTSGWVNEIGLPSWLRFTREEDKEGSDLRPNLIAAASAAACEGLGCSLAAIQDYLVSGVGMLTASMQQREEEEGGTADSNKAAINNHPFTIIRTNYIDSLAQFIYPIGHWVRGADADADDKEDSNSCGCSSSRDDLVKLLAAQRLEAPEASSSAGRPTTASTSTHATLLFQQSLALAALDGGYYQDNDLRGMLRHAPIELPQPEGSEDEKSNGGGIDDEGHAYSDAYATDSETSPDGSPGDVGSDEHYLSLADTVEAERLRQLTVMDGPTAVTAVGSLAMLEVVAVPLPSSDPSSPSSATTPSAQPEDDGATATAVERTAKVPIAAFVRRGTAAEEFAALYARTEALLKTAAASASPSSSATAAVANTPDPATLDALVQDHTVATNVRAAVRYDVGTDTFVGVPLAGGSNKADVSTDSDDASKTTSAAVAPRNLYTPTGLKALVDALHTASLVPLSALPALDGPDGSTTATSAFMTDIGLINSDLLLGLAGMYMSGESDHIPLDLDRAMCLAGAALTDLGYDDDQRTVLARVTYGEVDGLGEGTAEGASQQQPLSLRKGTIRDDIFYVEKEVAMGGGGGDGASAADVARSTGLYALHDAMVGVSLGQPIPMTPAHDDLEARYPLATPSQPLDLGIHCRHRDLLRLRLADLHAEDRLHHQQLVLDQRVVIAKRNGYPSAMVDEVASVYRQTSTNSASSSSATSTSSTDYAYLVSFLDPSKGAVFTEEQHVFVGKHGGLSYHDLTTAASAMTMIMAVNMEMAATMPAPRWGEEEEEPTPTTTTTTTSKAPLLPLATARALHYGLSCMTLQGYAVERTAHYWAMLNATHKSAGLGDRGIATDDELLHPPPTPIVTAECAPLLASLIVNDALIPNEVIAAIVKRLRDTEVAVERAASEAAAANEVGDTTYPSDKDDGGNEDEEGAEPTSDADHQEKPTIPNPFEELAFEKAMAKEEAASLYYSAASNRGSKGSKGGNDGYLTSFADEHLFIHIPYWNVCMRRAVDEEEETAESTNPADGLSPITRCRRHVAYHLAALAAANADPIARNSTLRVSPQSLLLDALILQQATDAEAAEAKGKAGQRRAKTTGDHAATYRAMLAAKKASVEELIAEAQARHDASNAKEKGKASSDTPHPTTSSIPELDLGEEQLLAEYIYSDAWLQDELLKHPINNDVAADHASIRRQGATQLALMHLQASRDPRWLPELRMVGDAHDGIATANNATDDAIYHYNLTEMMAAEDAAIEAIAKATQADGGATAAAVGAIIANSSLPSTRRLIKRHPASRYDTSRVGSQLFLAAEDETTTATLSPTSSGDHPLSTVEANLIALQSLGSANAWAPLARSTLSSSQSSSYYVMTLSYYHTIIDGTFDAYQAATVTADGAVRSMRSRGKGADGTDASNHPRHRQQGRNYLSNGNIFDTRYPMPRGSLRNPSSDSLADWSYDDDTAAGIGSGGSLDTAMDADKHLTAEEEDEFFFLRDLSKPQQPTRDYSKMGDWSPPTDNGDYYQSLYGTDDEAVAVSLLLTAHAQHAMAAALVDGVATSAATSAFTNNPYAHSGNPFAAYDTMTMMHDAHHESACRVGDTSQRLFAESSLATDGSGRRVLPDWETGGAGATRSATMAKYFGRTRLGTRAEKDAVMLLTDYAYVSGSGGGAAASVVTEQIPASANSSAPIPHQSPSRFFLTPAVLFFTALDTTVFALLRSLFALARGFYLVLQYGFHKAIVARVLYHKYTPSYGDGTNAEASEEVLQFIRAAGLDVTPLATSTSGRTDTTTVTDLIERAYVHHLNAYYESSYAGLLASMRAEAPKVGGGPIGFANITARTIASRVFALGNVMQPGIIGRGGWRVADTAMVWSAGDVVSTSGGGAFTTPTAAPNAPSPASCKARDAAIYRRHQPVGVVQKAVPPTADGIADAKVTASYTVAAVDGTVTSPYFKPLAEVLAATSSDVKGLVPFFGGGGYLISLLSAAVRTATNILAPAPLCDPYAADEEEVTEGMSGVADGTKPSHTTAPQAVVHIHAHHAVSAPSRLPPAERHITNAFLKSVLLLPPTYGASTPMPSPMVPYSERRGTLQQPSPLYEAFYPKGLLPGGMGLQRSQLASWFGTRGIATTAAGVDASGTILASPHVRVSNDTDVLGGGAAAPSTFAQLATAASRLWMLAFFAPSLPWGQLNDEVFSWRWDVSGTFASSGSGGGTDDAVLAHHHHEGLAVPMGSNTIPSSRPIATARSWVGAGKALVDADAADVPLFWARAGAMSNPYAVGGASSSRSAFEHSWEVGRSSNKADAPPITDFIWDRYRPIVAARAGVAYHAESAAETTIATLPTNQRHSSGTPPPPLSYLVSLEQLSAFLLSTSPEEGHIVASSSTSGSPTPNAAITSTAAKGINTIERDLWKHLGQYDVLSRLPSRDAMDEDSGTSQLYLSQHGGGPASFTEQLLTVSHSPRDSILTAAYRTHHHAATRALATVEASMHTYRTAHVDGVACEHISWSLSALDDGGQRRLTMHLRTPVQAHDPIVGQSSNAEAARTTAAQHHQRKWALDAIADAMKAVADKAEMDAAAVADGEQHGTDASRSEVVLNGSATLPIRIDTSRLPTIPLTQRIMDWSAGVFSTIVKGGTTGRSLGYLAWLLGSSPPAALIEWADVSVTVDLKVADAVTAGGAPSWRELSVVLMANAHADDNAAFNAATKLSITADPSLPTAVTAAKAAFANYWACSGLGTSLLYSSSAIRTARVMGATDAAVREGDAFGEVSSADGFIADGQRATIQWSPHQFVYELERYVATVSMHPTPSRANATTARGLVKGLEGARNPHAEAHYLLGDPKCQSDMAWLLEAMGADALLPDTIGTVPSARMAILATYEARVGSNQKRVTWQLEQLSVVDAAVANATIGSSPLNRWLNQHQVASSASTGATATPSQAIPALLSSVASATARSHQRYHGTARYPVDPTARRANGINSRTDGKAAMGGEEDGVVGEAQPSSMFRHLLRALGWGDEEGNADGDDGGVEGGGDAADADAIADNADEAAAQHVNNEGDDAFAVEHYEDDEDDDEDGMEDLGDLITGHEAKLRFGADLFDRFPAPRHGLYRHAVGRRPRPLYADAAVVPRRGKSAAEGVVSADATAATRRRRSAKVMADPTDPLLCRLQSSAQGAIVYPPHSSGFAFGEDRESLTVANDARRGQLSLPHLVSLHEQANELRPAPAPWPPRLGEGRAHFGEDGLLQKQSAEGVVQAAEWLQWWRNLWV